MAGKEDTSGRARILAFLQANVGRVVTTHEIGKIAGIQDYQRRIRELRHNEGWPIKSDKDRYDLKPGQYILESLDRAPVIGHGISQQLRVEILERNGYTCQMCGAGPGDPDPFDPSRTIRLHVDHIIPESQGGSPDKENLRVLCSACNQGRSNIQTPSETALNLLARIRRASRSVQREILEALKRSLEFGK